jgi:hypothetical protein
MRCAPAAAAQAPAMIHTWQSGVVCAFALYHHSGARDMWKRVLKGNSVESRLCNTFAFKAVLSGSRYTASARVCTRLLCVSKHVTCVHVHAYYYVCISTSRVGRGIVWQIQRSFVLLEVGVPRLLRVSYGAILPYNARPANAAPARTQHEPRVPPPQPTSLPPPTHLNVKFAASVNWLLALNCNHAVMPRSRTTCGAAITSAAAASAPTRARSSE